MSDNDEDDGPVVVVTECRHFWRTRNPIPQRSPISYGPGGRYIALPPFKPMCRACAGILETRVMTPDEIDEVTGETAADYEAALGEAERIVRARASELAAATGLDAADIEAEIIARQITPGEWAQEHGLDPITFRRARSLPDVAPDYPKQTHVSESQQKRKRS